MRSAALILAALAAGAVLAALGCAPARADRRGDPARSPSEAAIQTQELVVTLPPGRQALTAPLALPTPLPPNIRRVILDGRGETMLTGGLQITEPHWEPPDAALLAELPPESHAHARVLALPAEALAAWSDGLAGPVHSGHGVEVAFAPSEVFIGGQPLTAARWPNEGFAPIAEVLDAGSIPRNSESDIPVAKRTREAPRGGTFVPADRARAARWLQSPDAWFAGYWNWDWSEETLPVASIDAARGAVTLAMPHRYGLAQRGKFRVLHVLAELDAPGECWIDRANRRIVAWLPAGSDDGAGGGAPVEISLLRAPLLVVPGRNASATADTPVEFTVRGVHFAATCGPAIVAEHAHGLVIEDCTFRNIGTAAIRIDGASCTVARCRFDQVGGTGVRLTGGERRTLSPGRNTVEDCVFRRCGRLQRSYHPAIDLAGVGNAVLRNEISDLPHFAIFFAGCEHRIEANHIHHVVQETGDAGAVYVGRDFTTQGTLLRGNLVHDIAGSDARYQNAFYFDDMTSGITAEHNLFVRCNWGLLIGGGRDNRVLDNAFVACGTSVVYDARGVGWMASAFEDPETSTLLTRLAATPIDEEPWKSRYPRLASYRTDRFARPVGGEVRRNTLVASGPSRIEDRTLVEESDTTTLPLPDDRTLEAVCDGWIDAACAGVMNLGTARLGPVGPRRTPPAFPR